MTALPDLLFMRSLWGMPGNDTNAHLSRIAEAGYDGVEAYWDGNEPDLPQRIQQWGLRWVAQIHTRRQWEKDGALLLKQAMISAAEGNAGWINLHTGTDMRTVEENVLVVDQAETWGKELGLRVVHETHRSRMTANAPMTARLIELRPDLRFCADLSHWCCVHESLLEDLGEVVDSVLARTEILHARVGFAQGPQVPDWRSPAFQTEVEAHLAWWDSAVKLARAKGRPLVICPEFGPPPYQPVNPATGEPLADIWELNLDMATLLRNRYASPPANGSR